MKDLDIVRLQEGAKNKIPNVITKDNGDGTTMVLWQMSKNWRGSSESTIPLMALDNVYGSWVSQKGFRKGSRRKTFKSLDGAIKSGRLQVKKMVAKDPETFEQYL